MGSIKKILIYL